MPRCPGAGRGGAGGAAVLLLDVLHPQDTLRVQGGVLRSVMAKYTRFIQEMWIRYCSFIPYSRYYYIPGGDQDESVNSIVYNTYYQWVPLYLIFMAFVFYLPRMFWLSMEGGLMKFLCKGTTTRCRRSSLIFHCLGQTSNVISRRNIEDADEKRVKLIRFFTKNIHNKYEVRPSSSTVGQIDICLQIQHLLRRVRVLRVPQLRPGVPPHPPHSSLPPLPLRGLRVSGEIVDCALQSAITTYR